MAKKTTSDQLKSFFAQHGGGDEKDWKRLSKKKDADGQWVRVFENKKLGTQLEVVELEGGKFLARKLTETANENFAKQPSGTSIETDPAKNAAADKAIAIIMGDEEEDNSRDSSFGVPQKLISEAGKALANRYCFALCTEDDMISAAITPIRYFEENGHCSDQTGPISDLLPKCGELMESTWEIYEESVANPVEAAKYLQGLGFVWNKNFQDFIDESLTKGLEVALEPPAAGSAPALKKNGNSGPKI